MVDAFLSIASTADCEPYVEIGTSNRYLTWEIAAEAATSFPPMRTDPNTATTTSATTCTPKSTVIDRRDAMLRFSEPDIIRAQPEYDGGRADVLVALTGRTLPYIRESRGGSTGGASFQDPLLGPDIHKERRRMTTTPEPGHVPNR